ncbi:MAG: DNA replication and repair protein RecF [Candidatus Azotimanducaceae bacterium]|jgi:DNA replication and repair protein RecF
MHLERLSLLNFKNIETINLDFSSKINAIVGDNGEGKTNILDAIYYLSFCKSYFLSSDQGVINHDAPFFVVEGWYNRNNQKEHIYGGIKREQKKQFKRNKKQYDRLMDHIGLFPLVIISPTDRDLILDGSEVRRKLMDSVISQSDKRYLQKLVQYNKVLSQRNALLKYFAKNRTFDSETLSIYNIQLSELASEIYQKRHSFIEQLQPIFDKYYADLSDSKEQVSLTYKSQLHSEALLPLLENALQRDKLLQYTSVGIHKDDLDFSIGDYPMKKIGSQGQQKTFIIALKLAQYECIKKASGIKPILLLDDVFDKLDDKRVEALVKLVNAQHFGQIFITDTHPERTGEIVAKINEESKTFRIKNGSLMK